MSVSFDWRYATGAASSDEPADALAAVAAAPIPDDLKALLTSGLSNGMPSQNVHLRVAGALGEPGDIGESVLNIYNIRFG